MPTADRTLSCFWLDEASGKLRVEACLEMDGQLEVR